MVSNIHYEFLKILNRKMFNVMSKDEVFLSTIFIFAYDFQYVWLVDEEQWEFITSYWKIYNSMTSPFELQIDFKNDCNLIYAFFVKFKIRRYIWIHRRHSKNLNNLHKNSIFSKRYIISNEIVMENYKLCFKKRFFFFVKHTCRPQAWQDTKYLISELSFLQ